VILSSSRDRQWLKREAILSGAAHFHVGFGQERINTYPSTSETQSWVPDFMTIFNSHGLSLETFQGRRLKVAATCMLVKIPVSAETAQQVLDEVNLLCKAHYALNSVRVSLVEVKEMTARPLSGDMPVPESIDIEPFLPDFIPYVERIMREHGGRLEVSADKHIVHFPPRTLKRFIWPASYNWRYDIYFPDGYCILLTETRDGKKLLGFDPRELPETLKRKYPAMFASA
jgi:hypothetical protein